MNRKLTLLAAWCGCAAFIPYAGAQAPAVPVPQAPLPPAVPVPQAPLPPVVRVAPAAPPGPVPPINPVIPPAVNGPNLVPDAPILPGETPPVQPNIQPVPQPPAVELPALPGTPEFAQTPLTADEAARIALHLQPNVAIANIAIAAAQGRTQVVRAGLGPTVGVGASYTNVRNISGNSNQSGGSSSTPAGSVVTSEGYSASTNVRQLLFDFGRTRNEVRQAAAQEGAAGANLTRVQSDLILQVKQAFYTYVQDQRLIDVNQANVQSTQAQLTLAQARLAAGVGLPSDVVRAQTSLAEAVFQLQQARNVANIARTNLALTMGIDARTPIQAAVAEEPDAAAGPIADSSALDVNALVAAGLRQRPEVQQARLNIQAAGYGVSAARANNLPSITANVGIASRSQTFPPNNSNLSAGVSLQWDPFDSGLTHGLVRQAQAEQATAQQQLALANQQVAADVAQAYLNLLTGEQHVATATSEVANAQESVRLAEGRYRGGVGPFLDVVTAESALVTAQTNRIDALSAVDQARAALSRAIGAPLPAGATAPISSRAAVSSAARH